MMKRLLGVGIIFACLIMQDSDVVKPLGPPNPDILSLPDENNSRA
ncbi:hypothetical protein NSQ26_05075 [Bacillus sp. FSL W7-1360]